MTQQAVATDTADATRMAMIRSLWGEVLGVADVPEDGNFFDAGGDSLLLVALVERLRQVTGIPVRTLDVLRAATVRGQAQLLAGLGGTAP